MALTILLRTVLQMQSRQQRISLSSSLSNCFRNEKSCVAASHQTIQRYRTHPNLMKTDPVTQGIGKEEYQTRRQNLMEMICTEKATSTGEADNKKNVLIVLGAPTSYMTQDIPYPFHQNTNFGYLTGFQEPDSCVVIESQEKGHHKSSMFVQRRDPIKELWNGPRAGPDGAIRQTGVDEAYEIEDLGNILKKYLSTDYTIWYDYSRVSNLQVHLSQIRGFLQESSKLGITMRQVEAPIHEQRNIKSETECKLLAEACDIISEAFVRSMSNCYPGMNECEVHASMEYVVKKKGARMLAFPPVVAGGDRANTLHYVVNNQKIDDGSLVLVDAGAHHNGYVSDITRTWPINGKFSNTQRQLYEVVLRVQEHCIGLCRPGESLDSIYNVMTMTLACELLDLGILEKSKSVDLKQTIMNICPHHVGHWLGMDVHDTPDISRSIKLLPGMVITIEPGLYIRQDNEMVAPEYRGIGIRIEDDILITEDEPVVLSSKCPKSIDEIEQIMAK